MELQSCIKQRITKELFVNRTNTVDCMSMAVPVAGYYKPHRPAQPGTLLDPLVLVPRHSLDRLKYE